MIAKFTGNITFESGNNKITYNFNKVKAQFDQTVGPRAEVIFNTTGEEQPEKLARVFFDIARDYNGQNKGRDVNVLAREIVISFPPDEKIGTEDLVSYTNQYLHKMGYSDCPHIIYRHNDTLNTHVHILTSTITYDLTHVENNNDFKRSFSTCREIERENNLKPLKKAMFSKVSLSEVNARKYYFHNALAKAARSKATGERVLALLGEMSTEVLKNNNLDNESLRLFLGEEKYEAIGELLTRGGFFKSLYKDELMERLDRVYSQSDSRGDFFKRLEGEGIYARMDMKRKMVYGIKNDSFYISEDRMPQKYRYINLTRMGQGSSSYKLESEQRNEVFTSVIESMNGSLTYSQFVKSLQEKGIAINIKDGADQESSIFGNICFICRTAENPKEFQGSELSKKLAVMPISHILEKKISLLYNVRSLEIMQPSENYQAGSGSPGFTPSRTPHHKDDEHERKKKKKGIGDIERGAGV